MCHFWLLALLSAFLPSSGTNEEGLQIACLHLARYVYAYTGHAVPAYLRRRLARSAEAQRIRLEVAGVSLAAPVNRRVGPAEDRVSVECSQAAIRTLRYVLQRDAQVREDAGGALKKEHYEAANLLRVRTQLARALLMGRAHRDDFACSREVAPEANVAEVAKLIVAVGVRGVGLVSTTFGWLMASSECQKLLAKWMDEKWWHLGNVDDLIVVLNAGFTAFGGRRLPLSKLEHDARRRFGRTRSYGAVAARSFAAGDPGSAHMGALLSHLRPLERSGGAAALVLPMQMLPPELHDWYDWVFQEACKGVDVGFRPGEAQFMDAAGGALRELIKSAERGDPMYDIWRCRGRHLIDVHAAPARDSAQ